MSSPDPLSKLNQLEQALLEAAKDPELLKEHGPNLINHVMPEVFRRVRAVLESYAFTSGISQEE